MANTLPFKCYLLTNNEQDKEIRRFTLESDVVGNFTYLREKVRSVYPQLLRENFSISYIDEEGDKVTVSSDDELVAALMFAKREGDEPFRLIVQLTGGVKPEGVSAPIGSPGSCEGEIHWGVTCDGCQGAVKGFRYKCFQCPDFDLCGKCETAGQHPGHTLIRVSGAMPVSFQAMRNLLNGGTEVPHWRRKHHGRFHHQQGHHGWNACSPSGANAEVNPPTAGCNKGANKPEAKPHCPYKFYMDQAKETASTFQANHPEYLAGLGSTIASVIEGLGLGLGAVSGGSCPRTTSQKPETKKENIGKEEAKPEAKNNKTEVKKEVIIPVTVERDELPASASIVNPYAQLVDALAVARAVEMSNLAAGAAAAAAQEKANAETSAPKVNFQFGMTSQTGMTAQAPPQAVAEAVAEAVAQAPTQAVAEAVAEAAASVPPQAVAEAVAEAAASAPPQAVAEAVAEAAASAPPQAVADAVAKAAAEAASALQTASSQAMAEATTVAERDPFIPKQNEDMAASVKPRSPRGDSGDWTIVDHGTENPSSVTATSVEPAPQSEGARPKNLPQKPVEENVSSHSDPFICAALETMLAMGFTNEGGWLAQLLEVKGGDIGKTLDVLQSQFQRRQQF